MVKPSKSHSRMGTPFANGEPHSRISINSLLAWIFGPCDYFYHQRGSEEGAERGQRGGRSADHSRNKRTIRETNAPFANQTHVSRNKLTIRETNSRFANQTHHSRNKRAIRETNALFANKGTHLNVPSFQRPRKLPAKAHRPGFILGDDHGGKKRRIEHTAIAGTDFDQHNA